MCFFSNIYTWEKKTIYIDMLNGLPTYFHFSCRIVSQMVYQMVLQMVCIICPRAKSQKGLAKSFRRHPLVDLVWHFGGRVPCPAPGKGGLTRLHWGITHKNYQQFKILDLEGQILNLLKLMCPSGVLYDLLQCFKPISFILLLYVLIYGEKDLEVSIANVMYLSCNFNINSNSQLLWIQFIFIIHIQI